MSLSAGKTKHMNALSNSAGVIAAAAMDQRGSLKKGIAGAKGIPQDQVEKMRAAMKAAGKKGEIVVYQDADHGFNADYRPSYNKAAAEDGWKRMLAWFKQNGAG